MSKNSYPASEDVFKIVKVEGELGADQVKRVAEFHQAIAKLKTKKVKPTAEAVAKLVTEGRRTIRRAARAGAISW